MHKNMLIGISICAVLLLVFVSLTSVIGYRVVQSSTSSPIIERVQKEMIQYSNSECDCENSAGVTSWQFPFICATLGAIGVLVVLLMWNTDIGDNLLTTILILYELFNCG